MGSVRGHMPTSLQSERNTNFVQARNGATRSGSVCRARAAGHAGTPENYITDQYFRSQSEIGCLSTPMEHGKRNLENCYAK